MSSKWEYLNSTLFFPINSLYRLGKCSNSLDHHFFILNKMVIILPYNSILNTWHIIADTVIHHIYIPDYVLTMNNIRGEFLPPFFRKQNWVQETLVIYRKAYMYVLVLIFQFVSSAMQYSKQRVVIKQLISCTEELTAWVIRHVDRSHRIIWEVLEQISSH